MMHVHFHYNIVCVTVLLYEVVLSKLFDRLCCLGVDKLGCWFNHFHRKSVLISP